MGRETSAAIVLKEGESATEDELHTHLEVDFARFWLPDAYEFVEAIPMTATGKFQKLEAARAVRRLHVPEALA